MPISEWLPIVGPTLAAIVPILGAVRLPAIVGRYLDYRRSMREFTLYQHVVDTKKADAAVAIINAMKPDTPRMPKSTGIVGAHDEKAPQQLPGQPAAGRDDLSDRRGSGGGDRADPDDPGGERPGAA